MKIFSFFGKKTPPQDETSAQGPRTGRNNGASSNTVSEQRSAARATERKIDAIESAMARHLDRDPRLSAAADTRPADAPEFHHTMPLTEIPTEILFESAPSDAAGALATTLPTPVIEEAAILFANNQPALAEQLLQNAIRDAAPAGHAKHAYLLLFDLYRIGGRQQAFEQLSNDYISRFETSPPAWRDNQPPACATPAANRVCVAFPELLDGNCAAQVARVRQLGTTSQALCLDLRRIRAIDPNGCALLLQLLRDLHQSGHDLALTGAPDLIACIQSALQNDPRAAGTAPWLLLLELLRRLNREQEFEELSIDYCITFEISPPAFEAPAAPAAPPATQGAATGLPADPEFFRMPANVAGDSRPLIAAITAFAAGRDTVRIDCSQLDRIEFRASGQLMTGLVPLAGSGKNIEFHAASHLVAALLNVMGLKEIARIIPHKG